MAKRIIQTYLDGELRSTEEVEIPDDMAEAHILRRQAQDALEANADYLALASPSAAQTVAQVRRLTQQNNALIKLVAQHLPRPA